MGQGAVQNAGKHPLTDRPFQQDNAVNRLILPAGIWGNEQNNWNGACAAAQGGDLFRGKRLRGQDPYSGVPGDFALPIPERFAVTH